MTFLSFIPPFEFSFSIFCLPSFFVLLSFPFYYCRFHFEVVDCIFITHCSHSSRIFQNQKNESILFLLAFLSLSLSFSFFHLQGHYEHTVDKWLCSIFNSTRMIFTVMPYRISFIIKFVRCVLDIAASILLLENVFLYNNLYFLHGKAQWIILFSPLIWQEIKERKEKSKE